MKRVFCIVIAFTALLSSHAQKADGMIKGKLVDTIGGKPIADATISILRKSDSTLIVYTLSNNQGFFEIKRLSNGFYRVIISHQEYSELKKDITITAGQNKIDFGEVQLPKTYKMLSEVIVRSEAPIIIKNDTIQFNTSGFKTKPNATVEDLLKKLPGVEVDRDGNVRTQGERVQKIYVDGKEFFGTDPKLATKNLDADMVESVQVFDEMSEQAKFTRIDDGKRSKTINIKLKKDRKNGYFGKAMTSYGDRGHYDQNLGYNKFSGDQRFSLLFNTNNVNKQGFSDTGPSGGGGRGTTSRSGGGTGLSKSVSAGLNYNDQIGSKIRISSNYFYYALNNSDQQDILKRSTFTDSTAVLNRQSASIGENQSHRFNMHFEYQLDSATSFLYTSSLVLSSSSDRRRDTSFTFSETQSQAFLSIAGMNNNNSERNMLNLNNNLLFRHRFRRDGRTITIGWNDIISNNQDDGYLRSLNNFYNKDASLSRIISQDQKNKQKITNNNNTLTANYTEPLGRNKLLELAYVYTRNVSISDKKAFVYDSSSNGYTGSDPLQTDNFENLFLAHRLEFNFRNQQKKYNYQFGMGVERSVLENNSFTAVTGKDSLSHASYTNFFPAANFNIILSKSKNIRFSYNGRSNQPGVYQLQNVLDVTDPLNIKTGNPDLKQEFNHDFNLGFNTFNIRTFKLFAITLGLTTTMNRIVNSIDTFSSGVQLTRPENINGNYRTYSFVTFGFPFRGPKMKGSNLNFTNSISYTKTIGLVYKEKNIGRTWNVMQGAGINITKDKLDIGLRLNITYNSVQYSLNKSLNEKYLTQSYSADFNYIFKNDIIFANSFDYYVNTGRAEGFNQNIPLWNASISKLLFQRKNGEVKISVNDILNQNESINRITGDNYVQDTKNIVLRRYFLLSFFYNLNNMGKRGKL